MGDTPAVRARGIKKSYGDVVALDGIDLDLARGSVHGLVGPNGAGKTTLLGILLGLSTSDAGDLELLGRPGGRGVGEGVAGFVDGPGVYPSLTARANLRALAQLRGVPLSTVDAALDQVGLLDVADDRVRGFSLGMRQRLGLAAALLTDPQVLVLDEPANGLDPAGKAHVHKVIRGLADHGATVVLSSHRMNDLTALCDEVTILATGRVLFTGPIEKLAVEGGPTDHRLRVDDTSRAVEVIGSMTGLTLRPAPEGLRIEPDTLVVRGEADTLADLVAGLVGAGVRLRELSPLVAPLEASYLSLTEGAR